MDIEAFLRITSWFLGCASKTRGLPILVFQYLRRRVSQESLRRVAKRQQGYEIVKCPTHTNSNVGECSFGLESPRPTRYLSGCLPPLHRAETVIDLCKCLLLPSRDGAQGSGTDSTSQATTSWATRPLPVACCFALMLEILTSSRGQKSREAGNFDFLPRPTLLLVATLKWFAAQRRCTSALLYRIYSPSRHIGL